MLMLAWPPACCGIVHYMYWQAMGAGSVILTHLFIVEC